MTSPTKRERWDALVEATAVRIANPDDPDSLDQFRAALDDWIQSQLDQPRGRKPQEEPDP